MIDLEIRDSRYNAIDTAPKKGIIFLYVRGLGWISGKWREEIKECKTIRQGCWIDTNGFTINPTHWAEMLPIPE